MIRSWLPARFVYKNHSRLSHQLNLLLYDNLLKLVIYKMCTNVSDAMIIVSLAQFRHFIPRECTRTEAIVMVN
jgi:hypothetical protein